jgi:NADP-dependent 3-hydroxy acid dehydrogenase YdfG
MDTFDGRTAVITGGGSGIGRGMALALARAGANVVLADRDQQRLASVAEEIGAVAQGRVLTVLTDVADAASVAKLAEASFAAFGRVHVLCNNAGTASVGYSWETPLSDWSQVLGVNLMGAVHGIQAFLPEMLAAGEDGHIVMTASLAGLVPVAMKAPYTASKHAVVGLSHTLRAELEAIHAPIAVTVVYPGAIATSIIDDERSRYAPVGSLAPAAQSVLDDFKVIVDNGMSPELAGDLIVEALRRGDQVVMPNAEDQRPRLELRVGQQLRRHHV